MIIFNVLCLFLGLYLLFWSAEKFVDGATKVSVYYRMSPMFIGMVVIGFGTSFPELFVSTIAAYLGQDNIAIGNAYGSNIVNIAIILGLTALINPIKVKSSILRKELAALLFVTLLSAFLFRDLLLTRGNAFLLLSIFTVLFIYALNQSRSKIDDSFNLEVFKSLKTEETPIKRSFLILILGLTVLVLSSRLFSWAAVAIATSLGISDVVIGFTIVAIGTSMPELISSIVAARKGESDLAFGNIIGSNIFNAIIVVPVSGLIKPLSISAVIFQRDILAMCFITFILFIFSIGFKGEGSISKVKGMILIILYIIYTIYLITSS